MLHFIGLNHRAQAQTVGIELDEVQREFRDCLLEAVEKIKSAFIAEEDSQEALASRRKVSIAREIAENKRIPHRFCDPTEKELLTIGYIDGQYLEMMLLMDGLSNDEAFCKARAIEIGRFPYS